MTKTRTGLLAIMATVVMLFAMAVAAAPALAAGTQTETYTGAGATTDASITINGANEGETYKIYKVFDATVSDSGAVSYQGSVPSELSNYFTETNGNISATDAAKDADGGASAGLISALKSWADGQSVSLIEGTVTSPNDTLVFDKVPYGYYYITTTTGTAVTVTTTNKTPTVRDKNTAPSVDKVISQVSNGSIDNTGRNYPGHANKSAIAEVGSTVSYTVTIDAKNNGKNYVYHDTMSNGLDFDSSSVVVKQDNTTLTNGTEYTLVTSGDNKKDNDCTFEVQFADSYIQGLSNPGTQLTITYNARVTSAALQENPADNKPELTYGNNGKATNTATHVYNAKFTLTKTFTNNGTVVESGNYPEAGFVLRKGSGTNEDPYLYYHETKTGSNVTAITWVPNKPGDSGYTEGSNNSATELKTTSTNNELVFQGLANGNYTLIETSVPAGYNKANDDPVTVNDANTDGAYSADRNGNLNRVGEINNQTGSLLPTTGGPGTTLMYIIGAALVIAAAVALIARRKSRQQ